MLNNRTPPTRSAPTAEAQVQGPGVFESWTAAVARFSRDPGTWDLCSGFAGLYFDLVYCHSHSALAGRTVSIFLIKGGFAGIISPQVWPDAPAFSCLLWLWTKIMGTSEIMLRISSLLPMLAASRIQSGGAKR